MAVTYLDTQLTDRDKVRFAIQDTVENAGPLPSDANFSDNEINATVTREGSWQRAVAALFDALAAAWRKHQTFQNENGFKVELGKIADGYQKQADSWWKANGGRTSEPLDIGYRDAANNGDSTFPIFQRNAFGNVFTNWDSD